MSMIALMLAIGFGVAAADLRPQIGEQRLHEAMQRGAEEMSSLPMTGDFEHDFVWALKKHHQSDIEMANVLLKYSRDARARQIAQKVVDRQTREIGELDEWMAKHHQPMN